MKLKGASLYLAIAAGVALLVGIIYYFTSGEGSSSAPDDVPAATGIGAAISGAIQSAAQLATTGNPLEEMDNGLIFGGGA
jgi:hypothetical protein